MKVKHFLNALEHARVHGAIRSAEQGTSGDIVVYITRAEVPDALTAAHLEFRKLKLEKAGDKNSLLIFVAPKSQTFAVVGGASLHGEVGQRGWDQLSTLLRKNFKAGRYTDGLVEAIEESGRLLKAHFPAKNVDRAGQHDIIEE